MMFLGLLFAVALASAADVQEVNVQEVDVQEVAGQQSFLDVYASSSQRPAVHGADLYQGPVIVLANASEQQHNQLVAYYADNGIRSIVDSRKFQPLHQLLRASPNVSGLVISYQGLGDNSFLLKVVRDFVLPDNFKLYDLVRESAYTVPIVYVAPKGFINNHSFVALEHVARFAVDDFNIDQVPVNNTSQSTGQHPSPVVVIPIFALGNPYHFQSQRFNPFYNQYSRSSPFREQVPGLYPFRPTRLYNGETDWFPFESLRNPYHAYYRSYLMREQVPGFYPFKPLEIITSIFGQGAKPNPARSHTFPYRLDYSFQYPPTVVSPFRNL